MTDLEIIRQIEKELDVKLDKLDKIKWAERCYILNSNWQVTGLGLHWCNIGNLNRIIFLLKALINLKQLDLSDIYPFIQKHQSCEKSVLKELVQAIVYEAIHEHHLRFSEKELEAFQKLVHLVELNARAQTILTTLLLSIMLRKYQ